MSRPRAVLDQINVVVHDMQASVDFYRRLGVEIPETLAEWNDHHRSADAGQQPPYDTFWGARYAVVEDPSGNAVGLMSPIDPARRSRPTPPGG